MPPRKAEQPSPDWVKMWAVRVEVVVFPCVPATARQRCPRVISPRIRDRFRHGGRVHDQGVLLVGGNQVRTVFVMHGNTLPLQLTGQVGGGAVVSRHIESLEFVVAGQGAHADATDSYEVYVFHTSL